MSKKLLDFIYSTRHGGIYGNFKVPREEIEYYLDNDLDLSYVLKIRYFHDYLPYRMSCESMEDLLDEYLGLRDFIRDNNLSTYYDFDPDKEEDDINDFEMLIAEIIERNRK